MLLLQSNEVAFFQEIKLFVEIVTDLWGFICVRSFLEKLVVYLRPRIMWRHWGSFTKLAHFCRLNFLNHHKNFQLIIGPNYQTKKQFQASIFCIFPIFQQSLWFSKASKKLNEDLASLMFIISSLQQLSIKWTSEKTCDENAFYIR